MEVGRLAAGEGRGMELGMLEEQAQGEDQPAGERRDGLLFLCRIWSLERDTEQYNPNTKLSQITEDCHLVSPFPVSASSSAATSSVRVVVVS